MPFCGDAFVTCKRRHADRTLTSDKERLWSEYQVISSLDGRIVAPAWWGASLDAA